MRWSIKTALGVVLAVGLVSSSAWAGPVVTAGLTFVEQGPGVTLLSAAGTGSLANPIVLTESVTALDATIEVRGLTGAFGNPANSGHATGFWLQKVVTNNTGQPWTFFDHELQVTLGVPSPQGDGLSFADGAGLVFSSDKLPNILAESVLRDFLNFSGGSVGIGEVVVFNYVISDNAPHSPFFLRQRPNFNPSQQVPEPATLLLLGAGLTGLSLVPWRRRR